MGSQHLRVGYSGDERPTIVLPSQVGVLPDGGLLYGDLSLAHPREGMEIKALCSASEGLKSLDTRFSFIFSIGLGPLCGALEPRHSGETWCSMG